MSDSTDEAGSTGKGADRGSAATTPARGSDKAGRAKVKERESVVHRVRSGVASAVWLLAVLAALVLAVGALLIALGFNADHPLVDFVIETALAIDLGELKAFEGSGDDVRTKWVLVNWGIASLVYLVVGKVLDRVIRP